MKNNRTETIQPVEGLLGAPITEQEGQLIATALDAAGIGYWVLRKDGRLQFDVRCCQLFEITPDASPKDLSDLLFLLKESNHEQLLRSMDNAQLEQRAFDEIVELETGSRRIGRRLRLVGQIASGQNALDGDLGGLCFPVSNEPEVEPAADSSMITVKEDFEQLFQLSTDLFAVCGYDGYFKRLSPSWESFFGYSRNELMSRPFFEFIHPDDLAKTRQLFSKISLGKELQYTANSTARIQTRYRARAGGYFWLSWTWTTDAKRELIFAVARDITEIKSNESQLSEMLEKVRDSNSELQSFASVASHDMREPLRMITSYLKLLMDRFPESLDHRALRYINYACEGADRMRQLIDDLLSYARLDNEPKPHEPLAVDEVFEEVIENLRDVIQCLDAVVTVEVDEAPVVVGDKARLVRLFQNLTSNALKFHEPDQPIRIQIGFKREVSPQGQKMCVISVKDNGIGIDPDHGELLFNLFRRLHTRDEYEGMGMGLAICKKIAEQHGGRIWFDSKLGEGSTFYVSILMAELSDV
ncbi:MAG: ATP-binding protein [Verrucomicrobiota bacterium]